ncbi:hypothetical protein BGZ81_002746 [Podila clonocystis]|nr:hypothetical protein BGZ81_002746 [Podila clonocystis]
MDMISDVFKDPLIEKSVNIIVQGPPRAPKRDRDEDAETSSKGKRHHPHTLMDAIDEAGLTQKAVVDGRSNLSHLDNKERVSVLSFMGQEIDRTDEFDSLSSTARASRDLSFQELDLISTPSSTLFPVIGTEDLYVRQAYKDLYNEITLKFEDNPRKRGWKRVVVTGTSGIGKSAFLVYFTIRLLATSRDDNPPIVVLHKNGGSK